MLPRMEKVVWLDSGLHSEGWQSREDIVRDEPPEVVTVGFVVRETDSLVSLTFEHVLGDGVKPYGCVQTIAKSCIRSREVLTALKAPWEVKSTPGLKIESTPGLETGTLPSADTITGPYECTTT